MKRSLTVAALVLTIFVLGIITGLLLPRPWFLHAKKINRTTPLGIERNEGKAERFDGNPQRQMEGRMMNALVRSLDLTDEQRAPFKGLLEKQRGEMRNNMNSVRKATLAKIDSINVVTDLEMAQILNEDQLKKWEQFKRRVDWKMLKRN
jgi:Spy/CpxP family protein refolding chaperone